jgi:hypothetical protein
MARAVCISTSLAPRHSGRVFAMNTAQQDLAARIGRGVQLFRVRHPDRYFEELANLGGLPEAMIGDRRVWRLRDTEVFFALLTIPYNDEENLLVRADSPDWNSWDWSELAKVADGCRWRGPEKDAKWIN